MVNLQRRAAWCTLVRALHIRSHVLHLPQVYDLSLLGRRIHLDNTERCPDPQSAVKDVDAEDDGVSLTKCSDYLQPTGPDRLRRRVSPLGLQDFGIVRREGVKQVVNDVG
jgi:hypothetical protein